MTEDKLEIKDNLPLDTDRQTTSLFIEEREVKTQDGSTMTLQFLASMDLQKEAEQISLQFLPYTLLASFLIPFWLLTSTLGPLLHRFWKSSG